jgi:hypothetical protein
LRYIHASGIREIHRLRKASQCQDMMIPAEPASVPSSQAGPLPDQLRLAVTAYLARFKGSSREHTESDLRCYLAWCAEHTLEPLAVQRVHLELYIRWMQETRRFKPSTISRLRCVHAMDVDAGQWTDTFEIPFPAASRMSRP